MSKPIIHTSKKCGGTFEVNYTDDDVPYLICDTCGKEVNEWIKWSNEYKDLWMDESKWASKKDHPVVLLGYFCHVYKNYYGFEYTMSLTEKGLFKGPEVTMIRAVYRKLDSNAKAVKGYIDFIFERKVHKRKKKITNLSYLNVQDFINEYKMARANAKKVSRSTPLPSKVKDWLQKNSSEIEEYVVLNDFGDLKTLLDHYETSFKDVDIISRLVYGLKQKGYVSEENKIIGWQQ